MTSAFEIARKPTCKFCGVFVGVGQSLCPTCHGWMVNGYISGESYHSHLSSVLPFEVGDVLLTLHPKTGRIRAYLAASSPPIMLHHLKKNITVSLLKGDLRWDRSDSEDGCRIVSFEHGIVRDRLSVLRGTEVVYRDLSGFAAEDKYVVDFDIAERFYRKNKEKILTLAKSL